MWIEFQKEGNKEFDVFFVHPTTYPDKKEGMNASIETIESNDFTRQIVEINKHLFMCWNFL